MQTKITPSKIICTLGPASSTEAVIKKMADKGMSIARINFSHGDRSSHEKTLELLNKIREEREYQLLAVALDTKGPEIRTGVFPIPAEIKKGAAVRITTDEKYKEACTAETIYVDHKNIIKDLQNSKSEYIYIDDGKIKLHIEEVGKTSIKTRAWSAGRVASKKGVNIPEARISLAGITEKDRADIELGIEKGADIVFASFVRNRQNIDEIRSIKGAEALKIIAKIENQEGLDNLDSILDAADGIMIARGDLGVELDFASLFAMQCKISLHCQKRNKPFIVATQMLESTTKEYRPTRAEVTDVAFACATSAGCVMLSGETAVGLDPANAVEIMHRILVSTSEHLNAEKLSICINSSGQETRMITIKSKNLRRLRHAQLQFGRIPEYAEDSDDA